jgi:hypothetical protein
MKKWIFLMSSCDSGKAIKYADGSFLLRTKEGQTGSRWWSARDDSRMTPTDGLMACGRTKMDVGAHCWG